MQDTTTVKSAAEIDRMREAGLVVWEAHRKAAERVRPGATTAEINDVVETVLRHRKADAVFKEAPGAVPYPAAACVSVNDEIVHGIPGDKKLRAGDIVSIDIGARLDGWCADAAVTRPVEQVADEAARLLRTTEAALQAAIERIAGAERWRQIAAAIQSLVEEPGFVCVENLVGHGIGRAMWEPPPVPNDLHAVVPDFELRPGMVLAIEPMVSTGSRRIRLLEDQWTIATADGSLSAHFEHTIAITEQGPRVLTCGPDGEGWALSGAPIGVSLP